MIAVVSTQMPFPDDTFDGLQYMPRARARAHKVSQTLPPHQSGGLFLRGAVGIAGARIACAAVNALYPGTSVAWLRARWSVPFRSCDRTDPADTLLWERWEATKARCLAADVLVIDGFAGECGMCSECFEDRIGCTDLAVVRQQTTVRWLAQQALTDRRALVCLSTAPRPAQLAHLTEVRV